MLFVKRAFAPNLLNAAYNLWDVITELNYPVYVCKLAIALDLFRACGSVFHK